MQDTMKTMQAWVNSATYRHPSDKLYNTQTVHSSYTNPVEIKIKPMFHHVHNLSYTASGYGKRIPTQYMVKFNGKWHCTGDYSESKRYDSESGATCYFIEEFDPENYHGEHISTDER